MYVLQPAKDKVQDILRQLVGLSIRLVQDDRAWSRVKGGRRGRAPEIEIEIIKEPRMRVVDQYYQSERLTLV